MAKWIRNWQTSFTINGWGGHHMTMLQKELLLIAGYTVNSDDADAAWSSALNIVVDEAGGTNGFQVDAGIPREVYDPLGRFTQAMVDNECSLGLRGGLLDDDQNHSLWRITEYIDANHVKIDADGFNPFGWVTDTQLAGRIFKFDGLQLGNGAWVLMDGPADERVQIKIVKPNTSYCYVQIAPFGKQYVAIGQAGDTIGGTAPTMTANIVLGKFNKHMPGLNVTVAGSITVANDGVFPITAVSPTGQITYTNAAGVAEPVVAGVTTFTVGAISTLIPATPVQMGDYYTNRIRYNAYAENGTVIGCGRNQGEYTMSLFIAKLVGTDDEDTDPWVIWGGHNVSDPFSSTGYIYGLNGAATPAEIRQWFTYPLRTTAQGETLAMHGLFGRRVDIHGKTPIREPYVVMDDTVAVGACIRGRMPFVRLGYTGFQNMRPLNSLRTWLHWSNGLFFPMNGPGDQLPMNPPTL